MKLLRAIRSFILKRKMLSLWKEGKIVKWRKEGMSEADIQKKVALHKVQFWRTYKLTK